MANSIISEYTVDFTPLTHVATMLLSKSVGVDFSMAKFDTDNWLCCTVRGPKGIAVIIVFEFKADFDAHMTVAVLDPKGLSRKLVTTIFRTIFKYAKRVTAQIEPGNAVALQQVWRMGFRYEGYLRRGYDGTRDAVLYGLLPEECPYLLGEPFRMRLVRPTHEQPMEMQ